MDILAILLSFTCIMVLISKKVSMGVSLLAGALLAGLLLPFTLIETLQVIFRGVTSPLSIELIIIVGCISGLGHIMKKTGDLELMIDSLIALFKNAKLLSMLLPALIGTLNVPGGAILSAPMVKECGDELGLHPVQQTAINIFFRHIGYFIYPLYSSLIIASQLMSLEKTIIITYNIPIMLSGLLFSFFLFFRGVEGKKEIARKNNGFFWSLWNFFKGFSPILLIITLALIFKVSFPLAVTLGVILAILKRPLRDPFSTYKKRTIGFFKEGVNYQFLIVIIGVMGFKAIIEESGAIYSLAEQLLALGLSLPVIILLLGLITPLITGVHMAATGILIPLLAPLFPLESIGPYISLLFSTIILGYIVSPLHLCLVLSKEYYRVDLWPVYKYLFPPIILMLLTGLLQVILFG